MARVGRFATCNVSTPSSGAEGRGAGAVAGGFSFGAALRGRRVVSSSGRLPTHEAATASTADLCRFAGGSAGALQSGISSSESSDMIRRARQGWLQVAAYLWKLCSSAPMPAV